jgi:transposase
MYIEIVPNRHSRPAVLLREGKREGKKVVKRTLANLTDWPKDRVEALRAVLKGARATQVLEESFDVVKSRPHGHVAAVLSTLRRVGMERLLGTRRSRERDVAVAMIVARILEPASKLATARGLSRETGSTTLGELLEVEDADEDELYRALDWLLERKEWIEQGLAKKHLRQGVLVLYDLTSTYFEGRTCPLAHFGHSRDEKKGNLQIVVGLLCTAQGIPVAVEVFEGNTSDSGTLGGQVANVRERFGIEHVVFVGDRGLITEARVREDLRTVEGLDWISALTATQIRGLVEEEALQLSLFDERDLAEISSPAYPGERLVACKNPFLADERRNKREELLKATERELDKIVQATRRAKRALKGKDKIGMRVGKVLGRFKVGKHFITKITEDSFTYERDTTRINREAALDGIYVLRTSVTDAEVLSAEQTVGSYKSLSKVERAFRSLKTVDLKVRPIHHRLADRVRAHVLLCMLAYYVEWHMRKALAPVLFDDHDPRAGQALRASVVAPAQRSPKALRKARTKRTDDGLPVHSFPTLLKDLATIVKNRLQPRERSVPAFEKITRPTPVQQRALDLLGVRL